MPTPPSTEIVVPYGSDSRAGVARICRPTSGDAGRGTPPGRAPVAEAKFHRIEPDFHDAAVLVPAVVDDALIPHRPVGTGKEPVHEPGVEVGVGRGPGPS